MRVEYSFLDLYPYILLLLFFVFVYNSKQSEKKKEYIIFITILCFTILRYNVGWDYETYVSEISNGPEYIYSSRYEPIPKLIFYLASLWNFYPLVFIVCGTIYLYLLRKFINELSSDKPLSWLFYFLIPLFFLQDLSTIRQAVATQFVLCSYLYIRKNDFLKFIICIFIGSLFHVSCLYGICLYFICRKRISNYINWGLFLSSFIASEIVRNILVNIVVGGRFSIYFLKMFDFHETSLLNYYYYAINILILLNYKNLVRCCKENAIFIQIGNWGIVTFNLFIFEPITSTRLSVFFLMFWILILASLPKANRLLKKRMVLLTPFVFIFFFFMMLYVDAYNSRIANKVSFIPYQFWFNNL